VCEVCEVCVCGVSSRYDLQRSSQGEEGIIGTSL
jgi:hypothetical protein